MSKRVLLVKMSSLGDIVHSLPAVHDAQKHGYVFDWVVEEAFADLPEVLDGIGVIPVAWRRWRKSVMHSRSEMASFYRQLRGTNYDIVLDSQGLLKSSVVSLLARGRRSGYSHTSAREPWAAFTYHQRYRILRRQHAIDRQRQLFAAALGYEVDLGGFSLDVPRTSAPEGGKDLIFLHGTTWASKHWPVSMWHRLVEYARAAGYRVLVTWGNDEERHRAAALSRAGARVLERMPLAEFTQKLLAAHLVVGVDSGLTHLSAALGVPTLGLYGSTDTFLTGCRGPRAEFLAADLACAPCVQARCQRYRGPDLRWREEIVQPPCFAQNHPERVWAKCRQMLAATGDTR